MSNTAACYRAICKTATPYRAIWKIKTSFRAICKIVIPYSAICKISFWYRDKDLEPRRGSWVRRTQNNHVPATQTHTTILRLAHCVEHNATITFQEETPCEQSFIFKL